MKLIPSLACLFLATSLAAQQAADSVAPEAAAAGVFEGLSPEISAALAAKANGVPVSSDTWMIAAANPLAVAAGADVLRAGGSAGSARVSAAIAWASVMSVLARCRRRRRSLVREA